MFDKKETDEIGLIKYKPLKKLQRSSIYSLVLCEMSSRRN
jgi:hypothetical protein